MSDSCKFVLELLSEALTPAEIDVVNKYIEQYGRSVGLAILIADLLRGKSRFEKGRTDVLSSLFDSLISSVIENAVGSIRSKTSSNERSEGVLVSVVDPKDYSENSLQ